ncbi:hypothetical protein EJD97_005811 [Solanum chilense]|uniref:Uncharacterized protein n=1 Tax=Solanum chilense TaxID=4083 RepID=A0A6N2BTY9_SOLCI|nr:hypothetical protein EJD97_005811 [Solanum chilense]
MKKAYILCLLLLFIIWCSPAFAFFSAQESKLSGASSVLHLEKLILMNRTTTSDELEARDRARHARILRSSTTAGAVEFYLTGSFDPELVGYIDTL